MKTRAILLIVAFLATSAVVAQVTEEVEKRTYDTRRIVGAAPVVDGVLDDEVWESVEWSGDFVQRDPEDGVPPTYQSQFKVVYDDSALYFAFRMFDDPTQVTSQLARRDWFPGDWIEVNIDSYFDKRTAFSFTFSVSGTRGDEFISNDGNNWDSNWDPVWTGASRIDEEGWTVETRVPLSQLRFSSEPEQTWAFRSSVASTGSRSDPPGSGFRKTRPAG